MKSKVAEDLSNELNAEMLALSLDERVRLARNLGKQAVRLFAEAEGLTPDEARCRLMKNAQLGRRLSKVASE